jgi:hypothetical protein
MTLVLGGTMMATNLGKLLRDATAAAVRAKTVFDENDRIEGTGTLPQNERAAVIDLANAQVLLCEYLNARAILDAL